MVRSEAQGARQSNMSTEKLQQPPAFCQCAYGECDQSFAGQARTNGIFLYPSDPPQIAETVESAAEKLKVLRQNENWLTWKWSHPFNWTTLLRVSRQRPSIVVQSSSKTGSFWIAAIAGA